MRVRFRVGYVGWTHSATSPKCPMRQARNPLTRESLRARRAPGALGLRARRSPLTRQPAVRPALGAHAAGRRPPATLPHAILR